jgi:uncharacterized protein
MTLELSNDQTKKRTVDLRRIFIFLAFAFGIAWATGLVIYLTGGLTNSPMIAPNLSLALVLLASAYMWAPAIAHLLTRLITHEGWQGLRLGLNFRRAWPYWLAGWFLPALMTIAGAFIYFLIFPSHFDASLAGLKTLLGGQAIPAGMSIWTLFLLQMVQGVLISPILNSPATFGEEFGWRAYLQPKLMPLGGRKAVLWIGLIWGVWHWPVIFMGYEYGFSYPGYPWLGPLLFIYITFGLGIFLGWLALKSKSVWPAVIGHAAINGFAGAAAFAIKGNVNPLLGPVPVGIIGSLGFAAVALWIFFSKKGLTEPED